VVDGAKLVEVLFPEEADLIPFGRIGNLSEQGGPHRTAALPALVLSLFVGSGL
jgi:hypothetical protein